MGVCPQLPHGTLGVSQVEPSLSLLVLVLPPSCSSEPSAPSQGPVAGHVKWRALCRFETRQSSEALDQPQPFAKVPWFPLARRKYCYENQTGKGILLKCFQMVKVLHRCKIFLPLEKVLIRCSWRLCRVTVACEVLCMGVLQSETKDDNQKRRNKKCRCSPAGVPQLVE